MAELVLEMAQWKIFMSWVQVLDFTKSLIYSNCQHDRFFFLFRLCAMYAFYHLYVYLSFRANLMLCINYL